MLISIYNRDFIYIDPICQLVRPNTCISLLDCAILLAIKQERVESTSFRNVAHELQLTQNICNLAVLYRDIFASTIKNTEFVREMTLWQQLSVSIVKCELFGIIK